MLVVPLVGDGAAVGAIILRRSEMRPFTNKQIDPLKSFADQAVIAIENTRLFEEVQARTRGLQDSLEYQTAISDVLNVISRSPTVVQPVFDMIAKNAMELCHAEFGNVFRFDGQLVHFVASHGTQPQARKITLSNPFAVGRAILSNAIEELPDVNADPDYAVRDMQHRGRTYEKGRKSNRRADCGSVASRTLSWWPKSKRN
jgi:hypothetical protein